MQPFTQHEGVAVALRSNALASAINTPLPLPMVASGASPTLSQLVCQLLPPAVDGHGQVEFILSQGPYRQTSILLSDGEFGGGEAQLGVAHKLGALGVRVVIAPSFGNGFFTDCIQQGLLPVELPDDAIACLMATADELAGAAPLLIDLASQHIFSPLNAPIRFALAPTVKSSLLAG